MTPNCFMLWNVSDANACSWYDLNIWLSISNFGKYLSSLWGMINFIRGGVKSNLIAEWGGEEREVSSSSRGVSGAEKQFCK